MNDQAIEQEIQAKGLTAPRIMPADIEANIVSEHYFVASQPGVVVMAGPAALPGGLSIEQARPAALDMLTFCVLVLRNGFTVTGESVWTRPERFDAELGRKAARRNAVEKIWPLMGYELRSKLAGIEANIASEWYFTASHGAAVAPHDTGFYASQDDRDRIKNAEQPESLGLLTFCVLVLNNGFTVTGESACASPENFDAEIGRKIARQNAINKVRPLMDYELRSQLASAKGE